MSEQAHEDAVNGHGSSTFSKTAAQRNRNISGRSTGSGYGATMASSSSSSLRQSMRKRGSSAILKRTGSTATTNEPFDRHRSVKSVKSTSSVLTRRASVTRSEYHEDLKPILATGLNVNLVFTTFVIVFGSSFLVGYNIGVLNVPAQLSCSWGSAAFELIKEFYNATYNDRYGNVSDSTLTLTWSLTTALFIPGGMVGAFLGGLLADNIGRKKTILMSHTFAFLGSSVSCACVAAKSPELLMLGRLLVGVNSGLANCIAPMFLSEIAPFNYRGAFGTLHQLSVTLGILLSSVLGIPAILGTANLWPFLILVQAGPALFSLIVLPCLPESPRFLLLVQQNRQAAEKALKFYRRSDDVDNDMEEMDTEDRQQAVEKLAEAGDGSGNGAAASDETDKKTFSVKQLLSPDLRRPLFVACMLQVIQQFSGINAVFFYSQGIFKNAGVEPAQIPYAVIGTNAVNVLMTVVAVPMMDIAGRRPLLLYPMLAMIVDLSAMTACFVLQANGYQSSLIAYVSIGCIIIYVVAFAIGLGPIPMMIGAELFRQGPRPKAMACAGVVNWIGTFVIAMGFESIQEAANEYTFLIFVVLLVGFVIFTYIFVPETKNKTFEEIAHQFSPGGHLEVEEMVADDENVFEDFPPGGSTVPNEDGEHEDHHLVTLNFGGGSKKTTEAAATAATTVEATS